MQIRMRILPPCGDDHINNTDDHINNHNNIPTMTIIIEEDRYVFQSDVNNNNNNNIRMTTTKLATADHLRIQTQERTQLGCSVIGQEANKLLF